jgi:hypothetical protein
MQMSKRGRPAISKVCVTCNKEFSTAWNLKQHQRNCGKNSNQSILEEKQNQIYMLEERIRKQDDIIQKLMDERKKPRTITHTTNNTVNYNNVNVFGKESLSHITDETIQELIKDPETSIARLVTLKHSVVENRNIRVPNTREQFVQLLVEENGEKRWQTLKKGDVLGEIVENTAMQLDDQADEDTLHGQRFVNWHDKLKDSVDSDSVDGLRMYRDQMERVHRSIVESTRP